MNAQELFDAVNGLTLSVTLGKRGGNPTRIAYAAKDLPVVSIVRLLTYGGQRYINDHVGGSDTALADKVKAAEVLVQQLRDGITGRIAREGIDAVTKQARVFAAARLRKTAPEAWAKIKDAKDLLAKLDKFVEMNPSIHADAKEEVRRRDEAAAKAEAIGYDLSGLDL